MPISSSRESSSVSISQATSSTQADTSRSSINPILPQSQSTNQLEPEIERHVAPTLLPAQIQLESKAKRYHSATIYNQTESEDNVYSHNVVRTVPDILILLNRFLASIAENFVR